MDHTIPLLRPLDEARARQRAETGRLFRVADQAERAAAAYEGSLTWRTVRGVERLVRSGPASRLDRRRTETDLGPRGPRTERELERFAAGRAESHRHREAARASLTIQAAANREAGIGRLPAIAGATLRALFANDLLGASVRLVGAGALLAYECRAGGLVEAGQGADPMAPLASGLSLACLGLTPESFRRIAGAAEWRSTQVPGRFADPMGYRLDLLDAAKDPALAALMAGPSLSAVTVDAAGLPAPVSAPPLPAYVSERLRTGALAGLDEDATRALAQGRAAVACSASAGG